MSIYDKTWNTVSWAAYDHINVAKMAGEVENDDFLRDCLHTAMVWNWDTMQDAHGETSYVARKYSSSGYDPDDRFAVRINGKTYGVNGSTGSQDTGWIDISNAGDFPYGMMDFEVGILDEATGAPWDGFSFGGNKLYAKILKTPIVKYARVWAGFYSTTHDGSYFKYVSTCTLALAYEQYTP